MYQGISKLDGDRSLADGTSGSMVAASIVDYFEKAPMVDLNGKQLRFREIPPVAQEYYLKAWAEDFVKEAVSRSSESAMLAQIFATSLADSSAMLEDSGMTTVDDAKSLSAVTQNYSVLAASIVNENSKQLVGQGRSSVNTDIGPYEENAAAKDWVLSHYRVGDIITGYRTSSVNGHNGPILGALDSRYWGHDSILGNLRYVYQDSVPTKSTKIGVTAVNGVERERLETWINSNKWFDYMEIGKVRYKYWQWTGWVLFVPVGEYRYSYPDENERQQAYDNAYSYLGKPYSSAWDILDLNSTDSFWCSKLIWRAWYDVSNDHYDLHPLMQVSIRPIDIVVYSDRYEKVSGFFLR